MATLNGLPVYKINIQDSLDSNQGIDFISLVDFPAIEQNWVAMAENIKLSLNQDKQIITGPILVPDMPIYRFSAQIGEYYVVFTKPEIEKLVRKFQSTQKAVNLNYQHQDNSQIKQSVVQEIWLSGKIDKSQELGFNLPEGTAFVSSYIGDLKFWNEEIKTGNVKGYSIEGFLDMELKNIKKMSKEIFVSATSKEGLIIQTDADVFTVGAEVYSVDASGTEAPVPDGDYTFDNGMAFTVQGGLITALTESTPVTPPVPAAQSAMTPEQIEAIELALKPILDKYEAKLAELEVKLNNIPAPAPIVEKTPAKPVKESKYEIAMKAINKLKEIQTTK